MTLPIWFTPKADKQKQNRLSAQQERNYARRNGGRVQAGSGSSWRAPEDVRLPLDEEERGYLVQLKRTNGKGFRITKREWERSRANAHRDGREPKLVLDIIDGSNTLRLVVTEENAD